MCAIFLESLAGLVRERVQPAEACTEMITALPERDQGVENAPPIPEKARSVGYSIVLDISQGPRICQNANLGAIPAFAWAC